MEAVLEVVGERSPERLEAFKQTGDLDIAYQDERPAALPRQRLQAARPYLVRLSRHPEERPDLRDARSAAGRPAGWRRSIAGSCS